MAPPISKRSKQNSPTSPPSPIPLPGIALGLFAAIAAGVAASRALRRKRPAAQSLPDEQQSISAGAPPFKEREMEIKERDDSSILINANGTITIAHEPAKPAASLKPMFDAFAEVSCMHERDAEPLEEGKGEDEEEKGEEEDCGNGPNEEAADGGDLCGKGEPVENGKSSEKEHETAEIIVEIEASITVDEASVEALQSSILAEIEKKEEEEEEKTQAEGKVEDNGVIDDEDLYDDGYGDRNSVNQQPSPVLINGRIVDFFEEVPDFKDEPDLLSTGSNSLSDAVSESSMQEVSSAPVKPFVCPEESPEALWPGATPTVFNQGGQESSFPEDKNWSSNENSFHPSGMREEVPEFVEDLLQIDQQFTDLKHDWAILNDGALDLKPSEPHVDVGSLNLKPILVEIEENESSADKVNQIKFEMLSNVMEMKGNTVALEGKVSIKENGLDEGVAESSSKVLSYGSSLPEELDDLEAAGEFKHVLQSTREAADDFTRLRCQGTTTVESVVQVNGDESPNDPFVCNGKTTDETSLQTGQEKTDGTISDIHGEPDLLLALKLSGNETRVSSEGDLHDGESAQEMGCLGSNTSEELVIVDGILEVPAAQKPDDVDGTNAENSVKLKQEQSSLFIASKGITEGNEVSCEGNTDNVDREAISDGLSGQIVVKDRILAREQEIEEIMRSCDANDLVCEGTKLASVTDSAGVAYSITRDADYLLSKEAVHQHGLQPKGVSVSKILEYLPTEIGLICLLIALVSSVLWYLEVFPLIRS